jgi:hypothetical protein
MSGSLEFSPGWFVYPPHLEDRIRDCQGRRAPAFAVSWPAPADAAPFSPRAVDMNRSPKFSLRQDIDAPGQSVTGIGTKPVMLVRKAISGFLLVSPKQLISRPERL